MPRLDTVQSWCTPPCLYAPTVQSCDCSRLMSPCRDLQTIGKLEIWEISIASYDGRKELRSHKCVTKQISLLARFMLQGEKHPRISTFHHFIQHQEEFETRRAFNLFEAKAMWKRKKSVKKINLMMCQGVRRSNFYSGARQGKLDDSFFTLVSDVLRNGMFTQTKRKRQTQSGFFLSV